MQPTSLTFVVEPVQQNYRDLIDFATAHCRHVSLVVRHSIALDETGLAVLDALKPYLTEASERSEWPGTKLLKGSATVYTFDLVPSVAQILKSSANQLFDWVQPRLPEDLSFVCADDALFMFAISHEKDGVLSLTDLQLGELKKRYPALADTLTSLQ